MYKLTSQRTPTLVEHTECLLFEGNSIFHTLGKYEYFIEVEVT